MSGFCEYVGGRVIRQGRNHRADSMIIMRDKLGEYAKCLPWGVHANLLSEMEADSLAAVAGRDQSRPSECLPEQRICVKRFIGFADSWYTQSTGGIGSQVVEYRNCRGKSPSKVGVDGKQFAWRWEEGNMLGQDVVAGCTFRAGTFDPRRSFAGLESALRADSTRVFEDTSQCISSPPALSKPRKSVVGQKFRGGKFQRPQHPV